LRRPRRSAANHGTGKTRQREDAKQNAGLGHPHLKFPRDVQRKERKDERSTYFVDEMHRHHDPELRRKLVVQRAAAGHERTDHKHLQKSKKAITAFAGDGLF
jgi:hypothetical protein